MNYKVLLVDDDSLVRVGLKSFIDWSAKRLSIVGEASDGAKALEMIEVLRPDIVITDMYMPEYDGLQFIEKARVSFPNTLFIVLSCHSDINYVKESLRLGAFDYLLKSSIVDSDELNIVLDNAVKALDAQNVPIVEKKSDWIAPSGPQEGTQEVLCDEDVRLFLCGKYKNIAGIARLLKAENLDPNSPNLFLLALQLDDYANCKAAFKDDSLLDYAIKNIIIEIIGEYGGGIVLPSPERVFYILLNVTVKNSIISPKDKALSICERLRISLKNNLRYTCSVYVDAGRQLAALTDSYLEITQEISANHHLYYDNTVDLTDSMTSEYRRPDREEDALVANPINNVLEYIHQNYRTQITLDDLARISNFSKYHLCKKFKEKTKISIINYILMVRVDKAKELLIQGQQKIFEVAQVVGFNDTPYFNRIFKKTTGYTPKEFIEYSNSIRSSKM